MTEMRNRQKGLSILSMLMTIIVGGLVVMTAIKLGPLYMDDFAVSQVLKSLDKKPDIASVNSTEVKDWFNKGLQTNLIELHPEEFRVMQGRYDGVSIEIDYERRIRFIRNVDLIVSFEHDWKVKSQ